MATIPSPNNRAALSSMLRKWTLGAYLLIALYGVVCAPLLWVLARRLWRSEHYQFFPIAILGAGYLAYTQLGDPNAMMPGARLLRNVATLVVLLLTAMAVFLESPWLLAAVALVALLCFCYVMGGSSLVRRWLPAWVVLSLAVPLPLGIDLQLILLLQRIATRWASGCLDLLGYRHLVRGVVIEVPGHSFLIEEACSGINSLFAALTCALFYAMLLRSGFLRTLVLLGFTTLWVVGANAVRVALVTIAGSQWGLPLTEGVGHAAVGFVLFAFVLAMVLSTDRLLLFLVPRSAAIWQSGWSQARRLLPGFVFRRLAPTSDESVTAEPSRPVVHPAAYLIVSPITWISLAFLAGLVLLQASDVLLAKSTALPPDLLTSSDAQLLPAEWNGWRLTNSGKIQRKANNINGMLSRTWTYTRGSLSVVVSIDGPFVGWHNLTNCLEGQGWQVKVNRNRTYAELGESLPGGFTEVHSRQGLNEESFGIYATFDGQHRPYQPPATYLQFRAVRRFPTPARMLRKVMGEGRDGLGGDDSTTYQFQLFTRSFSSIETEQQEALRELFHHLRGYVAVTSQSSSVVRGP
ncbi:MAG: exosortase U [Planctomycetota bacterium]|nr:exosortase U [Planctomycetota bacterium]